MSKEHTAKLWTDAVSIAFVVFLHYFKWRLGKNVEGSGSALFEVTVPTFAWRDNDRKRNSLSQATRLPARVLNTGHPNEKLK